MAIPGGIEGVQCGHSVYSADKQSGLEEIGLLNVRAVHQMGFISCEKAL